MKYWIIFFVFSVNLGFAQQKLIPISTFYKDCLFSTDSIGTEDFIYAGGNYLPSTEGQMKLHEKIRDRTVTYTDLEEKLLKQHVLEVKEKDVNLSASPVGNFSYGSDLLDTNGFNLFQNTRGVFIEGEFFNKFYFQTSFYENQARFASFEEQFVRAHGEFYTHSSGYNQQNGMIPGAARTKAFKGNGFDYAFAFGQFSYRINDKLDLQAGNGQQFIGVGHRSLLYGSNSPASPYFRMNYQLSPKWGYSISRIRGLNLIRKKTSSSVESYYQPKGIALHYLNYKPSKKASISLFEGNIWQMGDSLETESPFGLYYVPLPGLAPLYKENTYSVYGIDASYILNQKIRLYSQLAFSNEFKDYAGQVGVRFYVKKLFFQAEYNKISKNMYVSNNPMLSYSNYNLPINHIKGNSFDEIIVRSNFEYKRFYFDLREVLYHLKDYNSNNLLPVQLANTNETGWLSALFFETGYRFNMKLNVNIFSSLLWRKSWTSNNQQNLVFNLGIRTGLLHMINDY